MADTMKVAIAIMSSRVARSRFLQEFGKTEKDIVYCAMIFMSGAKSEQAKKKAWKRARGLSYLVDGLHVSTVDIADAIEKHGGIEALARLAAKKQPRRKLFGKSKSQTTREAYQLGLSRKKRAKLEEFAPKTRLKMVGYLRTPSRGCRR